MPTKPTPPSVGTDTGARPGPSPSTGRTKRYAERQVTEDDLDRARALYLQRRPGRPPNLVDMQPELAELFAQDHPSGGAVDAQPGPCGLSSMKPPTVRYSY